MSTFNFAILVLHLLLWSHPDAAAQSQVKEKKQAPATVSGHVVLNGEPLRGVTVELRPERMPAPPAPGAVLRAESDGSGRYRITGIAAGSYYVSLLPPEFVIAGRSGTGARGKILNLADGEHVENFDLDLKRGGVITGCVTDAAGRPLSGQRIELTKIGEESQPQPSPFNHPGVKLTDEQGVYRIAGVPDGRYLVSAGVSQAERMGTPLARSVYHPKTFHPGVADPARAGVVGVSEGAEVTGVDIFIAEARKTYEIKGRVVRAETGEPVAGIEIYYSPLMGDGRGVAGPRSRGERSNAEGEFQFHGVLPGKYVLYTQLGGEKEYFCEPAVCEITESGMDGVEVKLRQGGSISGAVVIEGSNDPAAPAKLSQVHIAGYSKTSQPIILPREPAKINPDGTFRIAGLQPGRVYLMLGFNPKVGGFSIKRIERNGAIQPDGLEVGPGENLSNVRVVVGYGGATLRGELKVIGGALPSHHGIYVNLNPANESAPGTTMGAHVDARGQFTFENLLPGEYELRLVNLILQPGEPRDRPLSKLIAGIRQKVSVRNNDPQTVTLVIDLNQKERSH